MCSMFRRKSKAYNPLSPSESIDSSDYTERHCLPTHCVDSSSPTVSSPKQHSRSRIRMNKAGHSIQLERKFWIRVLFFCLFFWKRYAISRQCGRYLVAYLAWKADTVEGSLWRGTLPSYQWKTADYQNVGVDLVVSHCDLPLDWIFKEWAGPITFDKVTVISKCGKPVEGAPPNASIVTLPNLGRCDQSYAHYILNHYDDYVAFDADQSQEQNDKFIVFTKDSDNVHRNINNRHRSLAEMVAVAQSTGFACQEEHVWGYSTEHYFKICQPSAYLNWTAIAPFHLHSYVRLPRDDNSEFPSRNGKTLKEYMQNLQIPESESDIALMCFGGNFMFRAKNARQHPKELWERFEKTLRRGNNIGEGHYAERLWAYLLSPPLPQAKVQEILKQHDPSCPVEQDWVGVLTK